jgi:hypothetical protein
MKGASLPVEGIFRAKFFIYNLERHLKPDSKASKLLAHFGVNWFSAAFMLSRRNWALAKNDTRR